MASKTINIDDIEYLLTDAITGLKEDFLKNFMEAYSFPKATYKKLITTGPDEDGYYSVKQKMLYKEVAENANMEQAYFDAIQHAQSNRNKERFVIVNNFDKFMAQDTASGKGIEVPFDELADSYEFFLPWTGREITETLVENPADVKAAAKMRYLFESIIKDNEKMDTQALNVFLTRILFCYFADDTGIFPNKNQFIDSVINNTNEDGEDLGEYLTNLFSVLDIPENKRVDIHPCYKHFPYVNGGLFRDHYPAPRFTKASRKKLIEGGTLDWSAINPDIFGSMFQAVIDPEQRRHLGQHYTSVTNIMKVLNPLFLDDLNAELDKIAEQPCSVDRDKKLNAFRNKLSKIKVFDPACGSGNFLIIAYKELCHLEMKALGLYYDSQLPFLSIQLDHFYGIEIDDFPCEVTRLALWLVQHQINLECYEKFGNCNPTLPLTSSGNIVCGNALRLDWNEVCPVNDNTILYICGNPPYQGGQTCTATQKNEIKMLFIESNKTGFLDYVCGWFIKAARFINKHPQIRSAFVTTNSICQGVQVGFFWPWIWKENIEIAFCVQSFKWKNNAKDNAGVTVMIVGLGYKNTITNNKIIYSEITINAQHISPYGIVGSDCFVTPRRNPFFQIPQCDVGCLFGDGGNLILSTAQKEQFISSNSDSKKFIRKLIGSEEFIKNKERWCLWISDEELKEAQNIDEINTRLICCKKFRENGGSEVFKIRERYWQPREFPNISKSAIILPLTSSERRKYIPIGYCEPNVVVTNLAYAIYNAPLWLFSILTSNMHMTWVKTVGGRLKTDYRYSNTLCYNTFPFPTLTDKQKALLEDSAMAIIEARENHYDCSLAQLYNLESMPDDLKAAHDANDLLVDSLYSKRGFKNDEERLAELFRRYEILSKENN